MLLNYYSISFFHYSNRISFKCCSWLSCCWKKKSTPKLQIKIIQESQNQNYKYTQQKFSQPQQRVLDIIKEMYNGQKELQELMDPTSGIITEILSCFFLSCIHEIDPAFRYVQHKLQDKLIKQTFKNWEQILDNAYLQQTKLSCFLDVDKYTRYYFISRDLKKYFEQLPGAFYSVLRMILDTTEVSKNILDQTPPPKTYCWFFTIKNNTTEFLSDFAILLTSMKIYLRVLYKNIARYFKSILEQQENFFNLRDNPPYLYADADEFEDLKELTKQLLTNIYNLKNTLRSQVIILNQNQQYYRKNLQLSKGQLFHQ